MKPLSSLQLEVNYLLYVSDYFSIYTVVVYQYHFWSSPTHIDKPIICYTFAFVKYEFILELHWRTSSLLHTNCLKCNCFDIMLKISVFTILVFFTVSSFATTNVEGWVFLFSFVFLCDRHASLSVTILK